MTYASLPVLANWMIGNVGTPIPDGPHVIPVGFGLYAPSGVPCAGAALAMRDLVQELAGRRGAILAILLGSLISYLVASPFIALASATAFLLSEALDFAVFTPLRSRGRVYAAVGASNTVGLVVDTLVFLGVAGLLTPGLFAGQIVAKLYMTLVALALLWGARMKLLRISYETLWFRFHPITGPVSPTDISPTIYPTWRQAFELARGLVL